MMRRLNEGARTRLGIVTSSAWRRTGSQAFHSIGGQDAWMLLHRQDPFLRLMKTRAAQSWHLRRHAPAAHTHVSCCVHVLRTGSQEALVWQMGRSGGTPWRQKVTGWSDHPKILGHWYQGVLPVWHLQIGGAALHWAVAEVVRAPHPCRLPAAHWRWNPEAHYVASRSSHRSHRTGRGPQRTLAHKSSVMADYLSIYLQIIFLSKLPVSFFSQ